MWPPGRIQTDYFHPLETMGLIIIIIIIIIVIIITIIVIIIITRQNTDWPFPPIGNLPLFQDTSHNGDRRLSGQRRSVIFFLAQNTNTKTKAKSKTIGDICFAQNTLQWNYNKTGLGEDTVCARTEFIWNDLLILSRHRCLRQTHCLGLKCFFLPIVTFRDKRFCHTNRNLFYTNTNSFHI